MSVESDVLSAGAVALSSSSILVSLIGHMVRRGDLTDEEVREIYEDALLGLEQSQMDDESGAFRAARELIEMHLRPGADDASGCNQTLVGGGVEVGSTPLTMTHYSLERRLTSTT